MEKPEDKKPKLPPGKKPPPRPPFQKRPGGDLPKGPVPQRPQGSVPRVPPPGKKPGPPKPPNLIPFPSGGGKTPPPPPPKKPAMPPMPPMNPSSQRMEKKISETESNKNELSSKVAELEKKLTEEREKVLLASLRSKEEEAVSAKVETSIKEIQDKLRREKKEQELEENRRKAENKLSEMERRLGEEREAWVSTLKNQLTQRDQVTQEMETHFSSRLRDLEYRWSQEKAGLEAALRDREADISRLKQESALKSEQEKAFWEDRNRKLATERDKFERELERLEDKYQQEKDHIQQERLTLKEQVTRLESALRVVEEQGRIERATLEKQWESNSDIVRRQAQVEKDALQNRLDSLKREKDEAERRSDTQQKWMETERHQLQRQLSEKTSEAESLNNQFQNLKKKMSELQSNVDEYRQTIVDQEKERRDLVRQYEGEISNVKRDLEERARSLQARVDRYETNSQKEYEIARDRVHAEIQDLKKRAEKAEKELSEAQVNREVNAKVKTDRDNLQSEVADYRVKVESLEKALKEEHEKNTNTQLALEEAQASLRGQGLEANYELKALLDTRNRELEVERENVNSMKSVIKNVEKNRAMFLEKEGILKRMISDKEDTIQDLRQDVQTFKKKIEELSAETEGTVGKKQVEARLKDQEDLLTKKFNQELDVMRGRMENDLQAQLNEQKIKIKDSYETQIENIKRTIASEVSKAQQEGQARIDELKANHEKQLEEVRREVEDKVRGDVGEPVDREAVESEVRQNVENEMLNQMREHETKFEEKLKKAQEKSKKEVERLVAENASMKDDLRRVREARVKIEREAQDLLQRAEDHYKKELQRNLVDLQQESKKNKGIFSAIGSFLDFPLIDTNRKKKEKEK